MTPSPQTKSWSPGPCRPGGIRLLELRESEDISALAWRNLSLPVREAFLVLTWLLTGLHWAGKALLKKTLRNGLRECIHPEYEQAK